MSTLLEERLDVRLPEPPVPAERRVVRQQPRPGPVRHRPIRHADHPADLARRQPRFLGHCPVFPFYDGSEAKSSRKSSPGSACRDPENSERSRLLTPHVDRSELLTCPACGWAGIARVYNLVWTEEWACPCCTTLHEVDGDRLEVV